MSASKEYRPPYPEPEPRTFVQWCNDLGIDCEGNCPDAHTLLTYEAFCFLPNVRLIKVRETELYGFWRKHGDVWGEPRTVQEWLVDFDWELDEPTEEVIKDLNLFIGHDEFWEWSCGKTIEKTKVKSGFLDKIKSLFNNH